MTAVRRPLSDGALRAELARTRAPDNKSQYLRIPKNTSSSIRIGGGNCGNQNFSCLPTCFSIRNDIFPVAPRGIFCGQAREKPRLSAKIGPFGRRWLTWGRESCRCGNFYAVFRWKTLPACPHPSVEDFLKIFPLHRVHFRFSTYKQARVKGKIPDICLFLWNFGNISQEFFTDPV